MILILFFDDRIETLSLPEKKSGHYSIGKSKNLSPVAYVDGIGDCFEFTPLWESANHTRPSSPAPIKLSCPAEYVLSGPDSADVLLITIPKRFGQGRFIKICLPERGNLSIGRGEGCDICYKSPVLSYLHASILIGSGRAAIRDEDSKNGIYLNGTRVQKAFLKPGDLIYAAGLRLVFCKDHLAVCGSSKGLSFSKRLNLWHYRGNDRIIPAPGRTPLFLPPRLKAAAQPVSITIDPPPPAASIDELPLPLVLASSFSMGMMSVIMLVSAIAAKNTTSIALGAAMLCGTLFVPLLTKRYERGRRKKREKIRRSRYSEYLFSIREELNAACEAEKEMLNHELPSPVECADFIISLSDRLWERSIRNDALLLRAGLGDAPLSAEISAPKKHFSIDDDELKKAMYELYEAPNILNAVPVGISVAKTRVIGICGEKASTAAFMKNILLQLAGLYDPFELKLVFVGGLEKDTDLYFIRFLPHIFSDDGDIRFLAESPADERELFAWFEPIIQARLSSSDSSLSFPYYVFIFSNPGLCYLSGLYRRIESLQKDIHFRVLAFAESPQELPRESRAMVKLYNDEGDIFCPDIPAFGKKHFIMDPPADKLPRLFCSLASLRLPEAHHKKGFPASLSFLDLYQAGKVEHLNIGDRWEESNPSRSLAAAIGTDSEGRTLYLDLHERIHGPHALIAGMTGSGKSEFIISFILSMAVNFSPEEVSFVLIDYKGGSMAGAFCSLPHTAGIMTNLDRPGIARARISIESELKRRQALFAAACAKTGVGSMDIYEYQRCRREGKLSLPLSHLFLICDEFAELKMQYPQFLEQLISTARIGRSLGVHLVLATQKPGGIVDDQIISNSRTRICLRVQDRSDSMEMINRPDAAALTAAGRFYMLAGSDEYFDTGQAAWAGAPYLPSDRPKTREAAVSLLDLTGRVIRRAEKKKGGVNSRAQSQQDALIRAIRSHADSGKLAARPLWCEPLLPEVYMDELLKKHNYNADKSSPCLVLGELDDPENQTTRLLCLPLSECGHAAVLGAPGSGKTDVLNALLYSAFSYNTPDQLAVYIMDFDSGTLSAFSDAPHTGDVLFSDDDDKTERLITMLLDELAKRRKLFLACGGDYNAWQNGCSEPVEQILAVISGYPVFSECYPDAEARVCRMARDCAKYGIHLLISAPTFGALGFRMAQNIGLFMSLRQNDPSEYGVIFGHTDGMIPADIKGRGLIKLDKLYEFQTALPCRGRPVFDFLKDYCLKLKSEWNGKSARPVPCLPDVITVDSLRNNLNTERPFLIPVGYDTESLKPYFYDFSRHALTPVLCSEGKDHPFFSALAGLFSASDVQVLLLKPDAYENGDNIKGCACFDDAGQCLSFLIGNKAPSVIMIPDLSKAYLNASNEDEASIQKLLNTACAASDIRVVFGCSDSWLLTHIYEDWYRRGVSEQNGLWLGRGFPGQFLLRPTGGTVPDNLPENSCVILCDGRISIIKLPVADQ